MVQTGVMQRFKGKVAFQAALIGGGKPFASQRLAMTVTAVANTDFTLSLPTGATISSMKAFTGTAFTAVTDAKVSVGISAGDASYVALTSIAAIGIVTLALVNAAAAGLLSLPAGSPNLFVRIVQTGGSTAVGAATLIVDFVMP
jgi:hypothetical protein